MRRVTHIIPTHTVLEGGGFKVRRPVAMGKLMSPFLLLDEMGPANYAPGEAIGAPWHPHRGFETVTYMLAGKMQHEDSAGNKGNLKYFFHLIPGAQITGGLHPHSWTLGNPESSRLTQGGYCNKTMKNF